MSQSRKNLRTNRRTDGRTEGRTNGQTLFYRTLLAEARVTTRTGLGAKTQNKFFLVIIKQEPLLLGPVLFQTAEILNPLYSDVAFLYPLKISENLKFSDVFRGYRKATPGYNGLIMSRTKQVSSSAKLKTVEAFNKLMRHF